ncbi:hypothetical protein GT354_48785 [Streptomyces sp. SID3343]|nr:hypothetical protein [Streptomyces sp. SID3343]
MIRIVSFGYGHGPAPAADLTVDLRRRFRNPHQDPAMRERTGLDQDVYAHVLDTPGVRACAVWTARTVRELYAAIGGPLVVATGCTGGRHRAVGMARAVAAALADGRLLAVVEHRDVHRAVLPSRVHDTESDPRPAGPDIVNPLLISPEYRGER